MIRSAALLSVTGYAWYTVFAFNEQTGYPDLGTAILQLVLFCLMSTLLGYYITRKILVSGPTLFKLVRLNIFYFLLYTLLVSGSNSILIHNYPLGAIWLGGGTFDFLASFWQLLSWLLGAFPLIASAESGVAPLPPLRSVEISLLVIPAIFLLTYMNFPPLVILLVIISWFAALCLTLLTAGLNSQETVSFRYDIILIHSIVPCLLAFVLFLTAFSAEAFQVLLGLQKALFTLLAYLLKLLDSLFGNPSQTPYSPGNPYSYTMPEEGRTPFQSPDLLIILIAALAALFIVLAILHLIKLFRMRVAPVSAAPYTLVRPPFSLKRILHSILLFLYNSSRSFLLLLKKSYRKTLRTLTAAIKGFLPPQTPTEAVCRCYRRFLFLAIRSRLPRRKSETPLEYVLRLQDNGRVTPSSLKEILELTQHYLETCYSTKPADWDRAKRCQNLLKTIKKTKLRVSKAQGARTT